MVSYETYEICVDFRGHKLTLQIMTNVVHTKNGSENMPIGNFCGYLCKIFMFKKQKCFDKAYVISIIF